MDVFLKFVTNKYIYVPFILWFMASILEWMRHRKYFDKIAAWLDKKVEKNRAKIENVGFVVTKFNKGEFFWNSQKTSRKTSLKQKQKM